MTRSKTPPTRPRPHRAWSPTARRGVASRCFGCGWYVLGRCLACLRLRHATTGRLWVVLPTLAILQFILGWYARGLVEDGDLINKIQKSGSFLLRRQTSLVNSTKSPSRRETTFVLLLSYQRSGSSLVGSVFRDPDDVFYVFEPLDPLYCAMFGTSQGYNIPSDIFNTRKGEPRHLTVVERRASLWALDKIYQCQLSSLPPAMLAHPFWGLFASSSPHASNFSSCVRKYGLIPDKVLLTCHQHLHRVCGTRFGDRPAQLTTCRNQLWGSDQDDKWEDIWSVEALVAGQDFNTSHKSLWHHLNSFVPNCVKNRNFSAKIASAERNRSIPAAFRNYYSCLASIDSVLTRCASEHLDAPCRTSSLRVIKTVRAKMTLAQDLLEDYGARMNVFHVFRDPRGAVLSRMQSAWSRGYYSRTRRKTDNAIEREAKLYCSQVRDDMNWRQALESSQRSRTRQILYDEFVRDPVTGASVIYQDLGRPLPSEVHNAFTNETRNMYGTFDKKASLTRNESRNVAEQWHRRLRSEDIKVINKQCRDIINELDLGEN